MGDDPNAMFNTYQEIERDIRCSTILEPSDPNCPEETHRGELSHDRPRVETDEYFSGGVNASETIETRTKEIPDVVPNPGVNSRPFSAAV